MKVKIDHEMNIVPIKKRTALKLFTLIMVGVVVITNIYLLTKNPEIQTIYRYLSPDHNHNDVPLTQDSLTAELHKDGCVLVNVAIAQARLESNLGKSNVGRNAKNMFGITYHNCKYVSGKYGPYATYKTYRDNIKCYIHIQDYYLRAIDGKYAEAPDYVQTIKKLK
jgi:hypothetical protein